MAVKVTLQEVIGKVDSLKPNAYADEMKVDWINRVEGLIQTEIHNVSLDDVISYDWAVDADRDLLVAHPYTEIYSYYLMAMIDFHNNDISGYQNDMTMFNSAFDEYAVYYKKTMQQSKVQFIKNTW